MKAGTYVIQAKVGWLYNNDGEFVISSYGPENT